MQVWYLINEMLHTGNLYIYMEDSWWCVVVKLLLGSILTALLRKKFCFHTEWICLIINDNYWGPPCVWWWYPRWGGCWCWWYIGRPCWAWSRFMLTNCSPPGLRAIVMGASRRDNPPWPPSIVWWPPNNIGGRILLFWTRRLLPQPALTVLTTGDPCLDPECGADLRNVLRIKGRSSA